MSVATAAQATFADLRTYLLDPVSGPTVIPEEIKAPANNLFGKFKGLAIVVAVFCIVAAGVTIFLSHQSGRPNDGMGKVGAVFGGLGVVILGASLIGGATGT